MNTQNNENDSIKVYENDDAYWLSLRTQSSNSSHQHAQTLLEESDGVQQCRNRNNNDNGSNESGIENNFDNEIKVKETENVEITLHKDEMSSKRLTEILPNHHGKSYFSISQVSICQQCKQVFDRWEHIPYLLPCGHFLCELCITTPTKEIICPEDGVVAHDISTLKPLYNLIQTISIDNNWSNNTRSNNIKPVVTWADSNKMKTEPNHSNNTDTDMKSSFCKKHPNKKVTHFIENSNELWCIYCAFQRMKLNPYMNTSIKEIKTALEQIKTNISDKFDELIYTKGNIECIMQNLEIQKENERKQLIKYFNALVKEINRKKDYLINRIQNIYFDNLNALMTRHSVVEKWHKNYEDVLHRITKVSTNDPNDFLNERDSYKEIIEEYNEFLKGGSSVRLREWKICFKEMGKQGIEDWFGSIKLENKTVELIRNYQSVHKEIGISKGRKAGGKIAENKGNNTTSFHKSQSSNKMNTNSNAKQRKKSINNNNNNNNSKINDKKHISLSNTRQKLK